MYSLGLWSSPPIGPKPSSTGTPKPAITFASPFDSLVRVSTDQGVTAPLTAEELTTSGSVTLDAFQGPRIVNQFLYIVGALVQPTKFRNFFELMFNRLPRT